MEQTVHLNGGPWHGRILAIREGHDHFHIADLREVPEYADADCPTEDMIIRKGTYSRIRGYPGEYEWDGWESNA